MLFNNTISLALMHRFDHAEGMLYARSVEHHIVGTAYALRGATTPFDSYVVGLKAYNSENLDEFKAYYAQAQLPLRIELSPYADPPFFLERGFTQYHTWNVMAVDLSSDLGYSEDASIRVSLHVNTERERWLNVVLEALHGQAPAELLRALLMKNLAMADYAAIATIDGKDVGAGLLGIVDGGIAVLYATATLSEYRRRGVHRALIRARCRLAKENDCDWATTKVEPGSHSERSLRGNAFLVTHPRICVVKS
jgi:GNAT superfamily N-acetyltransferase